MGTRLRNLVLLCLFLCHTHKACAEEMTHDQLIHFSAHFGMSYAINTIMYGSYSRLLHLDKTDSLILSGITTLLVGFAYKAVETNSTSGNFRTSMFQNSVGVGASALTIVIFDFQ